MTPAGRGLTLGLGLGLALGLALLLGLWLRGREGSPEPPGPAAEQVATPAQTPPVVAGSGVSSLDSGGTLIVPPGSLPASGVLTLELHFPEPSADAEPRPVRVYAPDGRVLERQAPLADSERRGVRLEIPAEWLSPGHYVVEIETTERTHFPLRRYVVEVE